MAELQAMTVVKESLIWSLLQNFYRDQGPDAWKEEFVPQGSTANCYTADTYAAVIAAFLRDLQNQDNGERPLIIELGGGNGRFAWQVLNRLLNYHFSDESVPEFTYMLTDAATANVESWPEKARFKPYIESGVLEFGELLVEADPVIKTAQGDFKPSDLKNRPTIVIANYQFDCIPTDMFRVKDHQVEQVLVALESDKDDFLENPVTSFEGLTEKFSSIPIDGDPTGHPLINQILSDYAKLEGDFHFPVPEQSFRFLESFLDRNAPLLMVAGDLAYSDPEEFDLSSPFIFEGYFAHYTNFHMFGELFRIKGGSVQFQRQKDPDFSCGAFLLPGKVNGATADFEETERVAADFLKEFNPLDAHELTELVKETVEDASFRQIFAWLRFSKFDPEVAEACLPMVFEELEQGEEYPDEEQLYECYMEAYQAYFPDGSPVTIDIAIVQLCLAIKFDEEALNLIESSLQEFGKKASRLYVYALVLMRLERKADARKALQEALHIEPGYGPALRFYQDKFVKSQKSEGLPYDHLRVPFNDPSVLDKALDIYEESGVVLIDNLISNELLMDLRTSYDETVENWKAAQLGKPNNVGDKRFTVPIRLKPPFNDPGLFANPILIDLLTEVMGARPVLSAFGAVMTLPGARMQHIHREHPLLFEDDEANRNLPTYAINMLIPLVDLNERSGGTQLWEGTHRLVGDEMWEGDPAVVHTPAASGLILDYRVYHGGMPCKEDGNRPLLFLSYSLPWFKDTLAFESHAAVAVSEEELAAIGKEHRDLFRFAKRIEE